MNACEKCVLLKETIRKLYEDEGRTISYIHRLLDIDRSALSKHIRAWNFLQINQDKGKIVDFLARYKDFIIARIQDGWTNRQIYEACKVGHLFFAKVIEYDLDIKEARRLTTFKTKQVCEVIKDEKWKPILGYPKYEVSDMGRVRNKHGIIVQQMNIKSGYYYVRLTDESGKYKGLRTHRLVARSFCDGYSPEKSTVNHKDGNKLNNKASNLEWTSQSENNQHSYDVLNRKKSYRWRGKYIIEYKEKYTFKTVAALARFANISETQAGRWVWESPEQHQIRVLL